MTYIVDASVAAKWFVQEDLHAEALALLDHAEELQAPDLLVAEVANIAWKKVVRDQMPAEAATAIAVAIPHYLAALHASPPLVERATEIALTLRHPVYDCMYLSCAEVTAGLLITADRRFRNAVQGTEFEALVRYLGDLDLDIDTLPPLQIRLHKIHHIIKLAKSWALVQQHVEDSLLGKHDPKRTARMKPAGLGMQFPSIPRSRLFEYVERLSPRERAELVALGWLGRGYHEDQAEWAVLIARALPCGDMQHFRYVLSYVQHLEAGLAVIRKMSHPRRDG